MSLISINDTSKSGNFDLLASQTTALPGLTNNSDKSITVEITASGQWSLLSPDFETSDPNLTPYKVAVDADGYPTPEKESEYILKYPKLNPGVLVGEIKNAQGETKHLVSGKQQRFELQPNETVSFGINDSPQYFGDNFGKVTIAYSIVPSLLKATIYQHGDFQGISKEVGIGSYGVSELGFPNDALSSLKVPKGLKVTLYEHGIDLGRSKVFTADAGWVGDDFNDVTSAIKVELLTAPVLSTGVKIKLKSWKGDYLHRPDTEQGVTTWHTGVGNEWTVEAIADKKIKLKSWKGDYLHRPDTEQGVTSWHTGVGNEWTVEAIADKKIKLKSWKGDYLHRPDSAQGVTTWSTGVGNEWEFEVIS